MSGPLLTYVGTNSRMSARLRVAAEWFYLGDSVRDIARKSGISESGALKRLHRAGIKCREAARACVVRGRSLSGASF